MWTLTNGEAEIIKLTAKVFLFSSKEEEEAVKRQIVQTDLMARGCAIGNDERMGLRNVSPGGLMCLQNLIGGRVENKTMETRFGVSAVHHSTS